jgi:hypothetical protein
MFNQRRRRTILETRFRPDKAPMPSMARPILWTINLRDTELSRMELAACWRQLTHPLNLLLHFTAQIQVRNQRIC